MRLGSPERRLHALRDEVRRLREQVRVLEEQAAYVEGLADEARTKALVAQTPLADRERADAEEDARRTRAQREEAAGRLAALLAEQDRILEGMLEQR